MPFAAVFQIYNPGINYFLDSADKLAEVMSSALRKSQRALGKVLASANGKGEVAAAALLAGTETLIVGYRARFQPLAASLSDHLDAIKVAWNTYGDTGCWTPPPRVEPPAGVFTALVRVDDPRPLGAGERITAEYTHKAIDLVVDFAGHAGTSGRDFFGDLALRTFPPGGELIDLIDDAAIDHVKVFATMHTALKQALYGYIAAVQTSYQAYQDTGHWANPTVTRT